LVLSNDLCRLATETSSGWPNCVPVGYVYLKGKFFVPANRASRKVRNVEGNPKATLLIGEGESKEHGIMIECNTRVLYGSSASKMREYMRKVKHWQNDARTVIIRLDPLRKASWFKD
jgi:general stress protein 26